MPTITTVDATWDTGTTMDASELRRADTAMFLGDGSVNGVRGGIVRHGDNSLAVAVNGSDQVSVQAGAFVVPAATGLGVYRGSLAATTSNVALTARNATNPRIDLVVVQVASGSVATVKTIDGTPAASPSAPALPAQHIELARLNVPATGGGAVTVDSTWRAYAASLGGNLYVETAARLPGSGNQKGQWAVALDTGRDYVWNGTAWVLLNVPGGTLGYSQSVANQAGIGTSATDLTGLSVAVTVGASRRIRVSAFVNISMQTAGARAIIRIQEGAGSLAVAWEDLLVGHFAPVNVSAVLTPSAGAHTYKVTASVTPGATITSQAAANEPVYILVEDIGAV